MGRDDRPRLRPAEQRERRRAQTQETARHAASIAGAVAAETAHALREGAAVVLRALAAFGTLLLGLAVTLRNRAPKSTTTVKAIAAAYVIRSEARVARREGCAGGMATGLARATRRKTPTTAR